METSETVVKSSNEILTELFSAFNAEPPTVPLKVDGESSNDEVGSKHGKKSKKSKKSKKKHKHKKHKKKHKEDGGSEGGSVRSSKKKSKKSKEKRHKKEHSSPTSLKTELLDNKIPKAVEVILDKPEENKKGVEDSKKPELNQSTNSDCEKEFKEPKSQLTETESNGVLNSESPKVFEVCEGEKQKKGQIQIKDLKFSVVYQEALKAVEEKIKKQEERKADIEEGEISDSSNIDEKSDIGRGESADKDLQNHKEIRSVCLPYTHKDGDYSKKKRRTRSRSTSRHRSISRSPDHHRSYKPRSSEYSSHKKSRSRSRDDYCSRYRSKRSSSSSHRHHSRDKHRVRSRSRSPSCRCRKRRKSGTVKHDREKENPRSEPVVKIDKEKLLEIARKNALKLISSGVVAGADKLTTIKAGGKTVYELTEYCKKLSEKEALGDGVSDIDSDSSDDAGRPFHHPFQVRDRPSAIVMNIKNSIPIPVKSYQEKAAEQAKQLRLQFPVSSGSSHRQNESEWVPVTPVKTDTIAVKKSAPQVNSTTIATPAVPQSPVLVHYSTISIPECPNTSEHQLPLTNSPIPKPDISAIVLKRLEAMRRLQENPEDAYALNQMYTAQQEMQYWAGSKPETGAFTGSTGAKILTASELNSGVQAWAKRDQFTSAAPVKGGMGMTLLQKMGWQPGEGLGKHKKGTLEPLQLEVKMDKKGLFSSNESRRIKKPINPTGALLPFINVDGKHPVSLLNEVCSRKKFGVPQFELCFECGPDHRKNFLFKVKVNGVEYTPSVASPNKKLAKAEAATVCLQALGILPNNPPTS